MPECLLNKTNTLLNGGLLHDNITLVFKSNADASFDNVIEAAIAKCRSPSGDKSEELIKNLTITNSNIHQFCSPFPGFFLSCVHLEVFLVSPASE